MFTLEIAGTPVAVTDASEENARALFESDDFKSDLQALTADGKPLWDGTTALTVRPASEDEVEEFEGADAAEDEDEGNKEAEEGDENFDVVFLVDIDDDFGGEE